MLQFCVGKVGVFKRSDVIGMSIHRGSTDDRVMNPTLDIFSSITCGGWNLRGENRILLYLDFFKHSLYAGRKLQGEHGVTEMIYPPNI